MPRLSAVTVASRDRPAGRFFQVREPTAYGCTGVLDRGSAQYRSFRFTRDHPHNADTKSWFTGGFDPSSENEDLGVRGTHSIIIANCRHQRVTITPDGFGSADRSGASYSRPQCGCPPDGVRSVLADAICVRRGRTHRRPLHG